MRKARRIHRPHGFYLVTQGTPECPMFADTEDNEHLCRQIPLAASDTDVKIHAYCLLPWAFYFLLEIQQQPVGKFVQKLMRNYMVAFNKRHNRSGIRLHERHRQRLLEPNDYLRVLRFVTWLPALKDIEPMASYPYSSHQTYLGTAHTSWLTTTTMLNLLAEDEVEAKKAYITFMAHAPSQQDTERFAQGATDRARGALIFRTDVHQTTAIHDA